MRTVWCAASRTLQNIVHLALFWSLSVSAAILTSPAAQLSRKGNDDRLFAGVYCVTFSSRITLSWMLHPISKSLSPFYHILDLCVTVLLPAVMCQLHYNAAGLCPSCVSVAACLDQFGILHFISCCPISNFPVASLDVPD